MAFTWRICKGFFIYFEPFSSEVLKRALFYGNQRQVAAFCLYFAIKTA